MLSKKWKNSFCVCFFVFLVLVVSFSFREVCAVESVSGKSSTVGNETVSSLKKEQSAGETLVKEKTPKKPRVLKKKCETKDTRDVSQNQKSSKTGKVVESQKTETKEGEKKKRESDKMKEIQEVIFPLTPEEVREIRKKSESIKKAKEEEENRQGKVKVIYYDPFEVPKVFTAVNYAITVCFWNEIKEEDEVVVGSENFQVEVIKGGKCLAIFPQKEFKETNVTVFVDDSPVHFVVREVYDQKDIDVCVFFKQKPDVSGDEFLKKVVEGVIEDELKKFTYVKEPDAKEKSKGVEKKYFFDGKSKYYVYVLPKDKANEVFPLLKKLCVEDFCYVLEKVW